MTGESKLARHALLADLVRALREAGSWCGRTHIQKTLFSFQVLFAPEPPLRRRYQLYMHGPYSFELDADLAEMEFYGALAREERPPYGSRFAPAAGAGLLHERFGQAAERWQIPLRFVAREVGTRTARELEALTTVMHVRAAAPAADETAVVACVRGLKPHLAETEIRAAAEEALRLRRESMAREA